MAQEIYSGGSGSPTTTNSLEKLRIRYTPATPFEFKAGTNVKISDIIGAGDSISLNYKATTKGSLAIGSLVSLQFLAHVDGLREDTVAFMNVEATATAGTNKVTFIEFNVPVFRGCRKSVSGNTLNIDLVLESATVKIWVIDSPFQSEDAPAYFYNSKTVQPSNGETVPENIEFLYLPASTDAAWQLQLSGDTQAIWTLSNFYGQFAEDWVGTLTPYQYSNFVGLKVTDNFGVKNLGGLKVNAGASSVIYHTVS